MVAVFAVVGATGPLFAQGRGGGRGGVEPTAQAVPQAPGSAPYIRTTAPTDPVIQQMWTEGTQRSQVMKLAQALTDSIGARLTGSPDMERAQQWLLDTYGKWGITARREQYGTWNAWRKGVAHLDLIAPRVRSLEISTMSWSHSTNGQTLEGEVTTIPASVTTAEQFTAWLPSVRGKIVLTSPARLSCRMTRQWQEFGAPESIAENSAEQRASDSLYNRRVGFGGGAANISGALKNAGAIGVLTTNWSQYPGINKIFGSPRQQLPTLDVGCEDYGLLFRLAENNQKPRARLFVDAEFLGERPVFNVIAEMKGVEKPNEYVMLSAHFDSHGGSSGATDNATGTMTMMEAMRILKATYPRPKRTILVGHWSGEEQGLNGSRAFVEDHPDIVAGLHVLWNQDNGTGRVVSMGPGPFSNVRPVLERYLTQLPSDITQWIRLGNASGGPATGGSDHAGFQCMKAPGLSLGALSWDYSNTTWHTNRDTYDKIVAYDLRNNAMLTAMLTYLASEDPAKMPRDLVPMPNDSTGRPRQWPTCAAATRTSQQSNR
jgi:carboxypeptidase Q